VQARQTYALMARFEESLPAWQKQRSTPASIHSTLVAVYEKRKQAVSPAFLYTHPQALTANRNTSARETDGPADKERAEQQKLQELLSIRHSELAKQLEDMPAGIAKKLLEAAEIAFGVFGSFMWRVRTSWNNEPGG
jgi:hypothetical protein